MVKKYTIICCLLFGAINLYAQKDTVVIQLKEIVLPISKVKDFSKGYSKISITDSLVRRNIKSLTAVLRFNSFIYFKENGPGMVSPPSFRGTNASQTAVIWNGININSQLNGQTDFNAISSNSYDDITVRSGGGSVLFGSGAIGGTVHLNNNITFLPTRKQHLLLKYGSFDTKHISYNFKKSNTKSYVSIGLGYNASNNDFHYVETNLKNDNGELYNSNLDVNFGYKFNNQHQIKIFSNSFFSDRNLSRTLNAPSNDAYKDVSLKNLLEWSYFISPNEAITSKFAYVFDEFKFFDDKSNKNIFSIGTVKRKIVKLDYSNYVSRKIKINTIAGFESTLVNGSSFSSNRRNVFSAVFSFNHQLTKRLSYGLQFRQEYLKNIASPFLYSLGIEQEFNKYYTLSFNTSKNFRIPTFNDLYWEPSGNINLKPEESYQFEVGNAITFSNISFQLNAFYIKSDDLIQWIPNETGAWSPVNVSETRNLGIEFAVNFRKNIGLHHFKLNTNYSYTDAKDLETNKALISVPKNRANFLLNYNYKAFSVYYQQLFNDDVSFLVAIIPAFTVANVGFDYQFLSIKKKPIVGFKINNIYNSNYQNTLSRPMPGVNFLITTNINF
ncbi:TonB-dependent receptor plug domain-containing protein [Polaribacter sp. IC073]|uniref:TonB-dependent receptor plug domain-containing protein n=1 Tax=Polaribacter sp. IC073 TaxID=2508540 RepID=UPI0011BF6749|nr:TonB-dependent receptor [Polaribacter sp. IC073]TXD48366.1 TonB-dependent receptor [Polaribacter sp. IC073]